MTWPPAVIVWAALLTAGGPASEPRPNMLASIVMHEACYRSDLSDEQRQAIVDWNRALPAAESAHGDERFATQSSVWAGDLSLGSSGQGLATRLTYSFPNDGVTWGILETSFGTGSNDLNALFNAHFGAANLDRGRELLRQSLASWRRFAGLTYDQVADDNTSMTVETARVSTRGDIRLGSFPYGDVGVLAFNFFPAFGGDVVMNSTYMVPQVMLGSSNSYRYLRNTMAHEHGHGLGARHTVPCDQSKLMEPFLSTAFETVQIDDRRGAAFNYGDRFAGNHTAANAKDFGNMTTPAIRSVIHRNLSTNGAAGPNNTDEDWFRFSLGSPQVVVISAAPTGGSYSAGEQSSGCSGTPAIINASQAGNLNIQLLASNGTTVLQSATSAGAGVTETLNAGTLAAGTYYARVFDIGPNAGGNQIVQLYDLTLRIGGAPAPPEAIAGINKRIAANTSCYFMGDVNSSANEGGLTFPSAFDWDLDGDGTFEVNDLPQPNRQYPSNGVYPVKLRVTDTNGMAATDTILVTVFGASTSVASCMPATGMTGTSVPVTITGANLKNVTSASMVTVSGTGVSVTGTPVPNTLGTSITGLAFQISAGAPGGLRNITVSNADGTGVGVSLFNVNASPPAAPGPFSLGSPANGASLDDAWPTVSWSASTGATSYNVKIDDNPSFLTPEFSSTSGFTSAVVAPGVLNYKTFYYWRVTAMNMHGSTTSTPSSSTFRTGACEGDANYDRVVNFADITKVLEFWGEAFEAGHSGEGDTNDDDVVSFADITKVLEFWGSECF